MLKISIPKKDLEKANGDIQKAINLAKDKVKFSPEYIADTNYRFRGILFYFILFVIIFLSNQLTPSRTQRLSIQYQKLQVCSKRKKLNSHWKIRKNQRF